MPSPSSLYTQTQFILDLLAKNFSPGGTLCNIIEKLSLIGIQSKLNMFEKGNQLSSLAAVQEALRALPANPTSDAVMDIMWRGLGKYLHSYDNRENIKNLDDDALSIVDAVCDKLDASVGDGGASH